MQLSLSVRFGYGRAVPWAEKLGSGALSFVAGPDMLSGKTGFLGTQGGLMGTSAMMAIPSLMVFLSLVLKPRLNRWLNSSLGAICTLIMMITMPGAWEFYIFLGIIEILQPGLSRRGQRPH
jgi:hypothetical protein